MQHSETVPATEKEAPVGETQSATEQAPATASATAHGPVHAAADHDHAHGEPAAHGHHDGHASGSHAGHHDDHHHDHPPPTVRLRKLLRQESAALWVVLVYAAFIGLLALATPVAVQALVNQVTFGQLRQPLLVLTVLLFLVLLFSGALRLLQATAVEQIQQRLFVRLGSDLALLLPRVLIAQLRKPPGPRLVSRFFEIITVQKSLSSLLLDGLSLFLQSLIGLLVLGFYHPLLLGFDVLLLMSIAVIVLGLGRGAVKTAVKESRAKYAVADWLMELGTHSLTLRGGRGADWAAQRADVLLTQYVHARRLNFAILRRQIIGALLLQALASSVLLGLGGMLVIWGQLTIGQLVAAELIVSSVVLGVLKFTKHMESYYDLLAGLDKLGYFDDLKDERETGEALTLPERPEVLVRKVSVSDPDSQAKLRVEELSIPTGARVAVVGGRAKGLLAEVLYGLREADQGQVELAGIPVRTLSLPSLRSQVALLHDDREGIIAGSVADNLRFAKESVSFAELRSALQTASLWNDVSSLPQGLDTQLLSGAPSWSTSMRWRLLIARILIQRPRLVIVDGEMSLPADLWPLVHAGNWTLLWIGEVGHPMLHHCSSVYCVEDEQLRKVDSASHGSDAGGGR